MFNGGGPVYLLLARLRSLFFGPFSFLLFLVAELVPDVSRQVPFGDTIAPSLPLAIDGWPVLLGPLFQGAGGLILRVLLIAAAVLFIFLYQQLAFAGRPLLPWLAPPCQTV